MEQGPMTAPFQGRRRSAFSIIELLVVVGIIGVLMVLMLPAVSSLMRSSDLTRAGQMLADQVNLARQMASAQSTVIEVRLIEIPGRTGYTGIQIWKADSTGTPKAARPLARLPQAVAISANPAHSAAIGNMNDTKGKMPAGSPVANADYVALQIRPSGFVTPVIGMSSLFFTVMPEARTTTASLPANYFMLQINPLTGAPLVYRP
jgi:uncharacterized protein (TIGR02596 family)